MQIIHLLLVGICLAGRCGGFLVRAVQCSDGQRGRRGGGSGGGGSGPGFGMNSCLAEVGIFNQGACGKVVVYSYANPSARIYRINRK